jgi:CRP/FNR family transcriptional regulator, cyclic AMP receptor protein
MSTLKPQQLAGVDLLRGLSSQELDEIAHKLHVRHWPAGHCFVNFRDESHDVYFVLEGRVRVTVYSEAGREVSFRDLEQGASFGELAAIDRKPRSANVIAITNAVVASITANDFMETVRRYPTVAEAALRKLVALVRSLSQRVYEFSEPVPVRICNELIRLAEAHSADGGRTARLRPPPKHADIAARVNTHREAVSRLMSQLAKFGIVERASGELAVRDIARLKAFRDRLHDE